MIECENLVKIYKADGIEVMALQGLDLTVEDGEFVALIGKSGSGKSTLLNMLGGLDTPTAGKLTINGIDMANISKKRLAEYKKHDVGFVWQNSARNLLPYLTARENVMLPMILSRGQDKEKRADELLELVGLKDRRTGVLQQLSGGEQQRVSIAVALANSPKLLLADEPTGGVDTKTSDMIFELFKKLNKDLHLTIVTVTHDNRLSAHVGRVINIRDGKTSSEYVKNLNYAEELENMHNADMQALSERKELLVLDRFGRVQLPSDYLSGLGFKTPGRVVADITDGKIVIDHAPDQAKQD